MHIALCAEGNMAPGEQWNIPTVVPRVRLERIVACSTPPYEQLPYHHPRKMTSGNLPTSNRNFAQMIRVGERIVRYQ